MVEGVEHLDVELVTPARSLALDAASRSLEILDGLR
jgi:hypothetical protein